MIWGIRRGLLTVRDVWLSIERNHHEILRTAKRTSISYLGRFATLMISLSGIAGTFAALYRRDALPIIFVVAALGVFIFATFVLIGAYFVWEFFRYDLSSPANPLYYNN